MFIIAQKANQMCNRLFLFAHFIAFAREHNIKLINPAFEEYAGYFRTTSSDLLCRYPATRSYLPRGKHVREKAGQFFFWVSQFLYRNKSNKILQRRFKVMRSGYETTLVEPGGVCLLDNQEFLATSFKSQIIFFQGPLFRNFSYFQKHADAIREYFMPLESIQRNVNILMDKIRQTSHVVVGVHIRRGDYREFLGGKYYYSDNQYVEVMYKVGKLFSAEKVSFIVCSNEELKKENFDSNDVHFATGHSVEDLYAFAQCDYLIGPPSTYSAWASFYGNVPLCFIEDISKSPTLEDFAIIQW